MRYDLYLQVKQNVSSHPRDFLVEDLFLHSVSRGWVVHGSKESVANLLIVMRSARWSGRTWKDKGTVYRNYVAAAGFRGVHVYDRLVSHSPFVQNAGGGPMQNPARGAVNVFESLFMQNTKKVL